MTTLFVPSLNATRRQESPQTSASRMRRIISGPSQSEPRKPAQQTARSYRAGETLLIASTFRQIASLAPGTWSTSHSVPRMCGMAALPHGPDQLLGAAANFLLGHVGVRVERFRGQVAVEHDRWRHQVGVFPELPRAAQAEDRRLEPAGERPDHLRGQLAAVMEDQVGIRRRAGRGRGGRWAPSPAARRSVSHS